MRVLALDVGTVRIGVAVSDPLGISAQPVDTIQVQGRKKDATLVLEFLDELEAQSIVIGLPLSMNGSENEATRIARRFGEELERQRSDLVVEFQDERFTTAQAERVLIESGMRRKKRKQYVDRTAAVLILQAWLDSRPMEF